MSFRKLPVELRKRITDYYENRYQGKMFNEEQIKSELNESLRQQLINASCRELVDAVPMFLGNFYFDWWNFILIFSECDDDFIDKLLTKLKFEVYLYGDEIIRQGTLGRKMFFISRGSVRILSYKNLGSSRILTDGEFFGEIALLHPTKRRTASVFAESYCYMYSLDVDDMNQERVEIIKVEIIFRCFCRLSIGDFILYYLSSSKGPWNVPSHSPSIHGWSSKSIGSNRGRGTQNVARRRRRNLVRNVQGLSTRLVQTKLQNEPSKNYLNAFSRFQTANDGSEWLREGLLK